MVQSVGPDPEVAAGASPRSAPCITPGLLRYSCGFPCGIPCGIPSGIPPVVLRYHRTTMDHSAGDAPSMARHGRPCAVCTEQTPSGSYGIWRTVTDTSTPRDKDGKSSRARGNCKMHKVVTILRKKIYAYTEL